MTKVLGHRTPSGHGQQISGSGWHAHADAKMGGTSLSLRSARIAYGNRTAIIDALARVEQTFTPEGQRLTWRGPTGGLITYEYDLEGNRTSIESVFGKFVYTFDNRNMLSTVTNPTNEKYELTHDPNGNSLQVR